MLYAAHLGFLNSSIKVKSGKKEETVSKLERYTQGAWICKMPEVGEMRYILDIWDDVGKCESGGFGVKCISWTEIKSYCDLNGLSNWEANLIHCMSKVFVDSINAFKDIECDPPYRYLNYNGAILRAQATEARNKAP